MCVLKDAVVGVLASIELTTDPNVYIIDGVMLLAMLDASKLTDTEK